MFFHVFSWPATNVETTNDRLKKVPPWVKTARELVLVSQAVSERNSDKYWNLDPFFHPGELVLVSRRQRTDGRTKKLRGLLARIRYTSACPKPVTRSNICPVTDGRDCGADFISVPARFASTTHAMSQIGNRKASVSRRSTRTTKLMWSHCRSILRRAWGLLLVFRGYRRCRHCCYT